MLLSKLIKNEDYNEMVEEGKVITDVHKAISMWHPEQHHHRLWEYALAQKALTHLFGTKKGLKVSDHGCGTGFLSPILCWLGHNVWMYDCWGGAFKNQEEYALEQMRQVKLHSPESGTYEMRNSPLGKLTDKDRFVDAAFCVSVLEHIRDYQTAFRDLLSTVKPGGLVFLTTDFGDHEQDDYNCREVRAGKMFTGRTYDELFAIGQQEGFSLLGGCADWCWSEANRLVMGYGFGSMALVRGRAYE
jgi:ubiquinone/menaquinone biosynthesis C-methylase UbiE